MKTDSPINPKYKILGAAILAACGILFFCFSVVEGAEYYRVNPGATVEINEHGVCKMVTNNGSLAIFVPTKTSGEWTEFRIHHPGNISLSDCCQCSSGPCCDGCNYRPSSYVCDSTYQVDYECRYGTACGQDVWRRIKKRYCSGSSSSCDGSISGWIWDPNYAYDDCASNERCADNDPSCNYDASCVTTCTDMTILSNPFCVSTVFRAVGSNIYKARAEVFDLSGHLVWNSSWVNGTDVSWTGVNNSGQQLARGVYLVWMFAQDAGGNQISCNTIKKSANFAPKDNDGDGYTNEECMDLWPRDDCCDKDADVYPNSNHWGTSANNCGDFDYNCDGVETKIWTVTNAYCDCNGSTFTGKSGWTQSTVPNCGQEKRFVLSNPCHKVWWWWECDIRNNWAQGCY